MIVIKCKSSPKRVLSPVHTTGNVAQVAARESRRLRNGTVIQLNPDSATVIGDYVTFTVRHIGE